MTQVSSAVAPPRPSSTSRVGGRRQSPSPIEQARRKAWAAEWSQLLKGRKRS